MRKRRNSLDIVADILKIAKNGAKKTHIVYGANLNFKLLEKYTEELESLGLVTIENENNRIIKTTEKGIRYLNHYQDLQEFNVLNVPT